MCFRDGGQDIAAHLKPSEGLWRQVKVLIGAATLILGEAAKETILFRELLVHPHDAVVLIGLPAGDGTVVGHSRIPILASR